MANHLNKSLKHRLLSLAGLFICYYSMAQTTTCPAPVPGNPGCYQTARPSNGNPLTNWPPIPNQDCCNAIPLCQPYNELTNGVIIPENAPAGTLYPGCVNNELPNETNTCFGNNEKGTTWYKFQIRPLPGGPTAPGSPAGKLRFKIIPKDVVFDPDYDPFTDNGSPGFGNTDFDFLLFKIPANSINDGTTCTKIRNSVAFGGSGSVIASCNWTGTRGPTGLFEPGTGTEASIAQNRFNKPLDVKVGDLFYLAIDNFSVNLLGYAVDFRGLEASDDSTAIVNPPPTDSIKTRVLNNVCPSNNIKIQFGSSIKCDSVKPSKFVISGPQPPYTITSILSENACNSYGSDTSYIISFLPETPSDSLKISIVGELRDICGNRVLSSTIPFKLVDCSVGVLPSIFSSDLFQLHPNPGKGLFQITYKNGFRPTEIKVMDAQGKYLENRYRKDENSIDLSSFPAGLYFVQMEGPTGVEITRLIKE